MGLAEHPPSLWVAHQQINTIDRISEHPSSEWVPPVFEQIRITDKIGWTPIQQVSPVFQHIRTTDKIDWTPIQDVSHSSVFEQITTDRTG